MVSYTAKPKEIYAELQKNTASRTYMSSVSTRISTKSSAKQESKPQNHDADKVCACQESLIRHSILSLALSEDFV